MIDTPQWRAWLASATGFAVAHPAGAFTVRRERSGSGRGAGYWRAYRRIGGERRRVYLGRTEHVTAAALAAAAVALAQPAAARMGCPDPALAPVATKLRVPPVRDRALPRPALATRLEQASQLPVTLV